MYSQNPCFLNLGNLQRYQNFPLYIQTLRLSIKKVVVWIKIIIAQLVYCLIFQKILKQISNYLESIFSKFLCCFRKGHNAQYCFLARLEKWCKSMDQGMLFGALLTDLSNAFDCLPHDLPISRKIICIRLLQQFNKISFKLPNKLEAQNQKSLCL